MEHGAESGSYMCDKRCNSVTKLMNIEERDKEEADKLGNRGSG